MIRLPIDFLATSSCAKERMLALLLCYCAYFYGWAIGYLQTLDFFDCFYDLVKLNLPWDFNCFSNCSKTLFDDDDDGGGDDGGEAYLLHFALQPQRF